MIGSPLAPPAHFPWSHIGQGFCSTSAHTPATSRPTPTPKSPSLPGNLLFAKGLYIVIPRRQEKTKATHSPIAQLAEHSTVNRRVTGSSPVGGATQGQEPHRSWSFSHALSFPRDPVAEARTIADARQGSRVCRAHSPINASSPRSPPRPNQPPNNTLTS